MPIEFAHSHGHSYPDDWKTGVRPVLVAKLAAIEARVGSRLLRVPRRPDRIEAPLGPPGSYGAVYQLESFPDRLLKISTDRKEGPYSFYVSQLQALGVESPSGPVVWASAVIFDVFQIEHEGDFALWGIVVERLQTLRFQTDEVRIVPPPVPLWVLGAADRYTDGWDATFGHPIHKFDVDGLRITRRKVKVPADEARGILERGLERLEQSGVSRPLADFLRLVLADDMPLTDVHRNNLAIRRGPIEGYSGTAAGQLVVFDYGASSVSSSVRRAASRKGSLTSFSSRAEAS